MDIETAIEALNRTGYRVTHSTEKLLEFTCGSRILNRKSPQVLLITKPGIADQPRAVFGLPLSDIVVSTAI